MIAILLMSLNCTDWWGNWVCLNEKEHKSKVGVKEHNFRKLNNCNSLSCYDQLHMHTAWTVEQMELNEWKGLYIYMDHGYQHGHLEWHIRRVIWQGRPIRDQVHVVFSPQKGWGTIDQQDDGTSCWKSLCRRRACMYWNWIYTADILVRNRWCLNAFINFPELSLGHAVIEGSGEASCTQ